MMKSPCLNDLIDLWMTAHHGGQPAVIFVAPLVCEPGDFPHRLSFLKEQMGHELESSSIGAEFLVKRVGTHNDANKILSEVNRSRDPHTLVWDGFRVTGHSS